jgi:hypothetical protein
MDRLPLRIVAQNLMLLHLFARPLMLHRLSIEVLIRWSIDAIMAVNQSADRFVISGKYSYSPLLEICHECLY